MRKYQEQVSNGIRLLNTIFPDWRGKINLEILDLEDTSHCILGQLYGDYYRGRTKQECLDTFEKSQEHGFTVGEVENTERIRSAFQELTREWVFQVSEGGFSEE